MLFINSFLFCGLVCLIAQIILDNTKLTPGHITSMFVVIGAFLDSFSLYDLIIKYVGGGALVPITSFGHSLVHGALAKAQEVGIMGLFMGMFDITASGITAAIIFTFIFTTYNSHVTTNIILSHYFKLENILVNISKVFIASLILSVGLNL